jgi:hypothetical protein
MCRLVLDSQWHGEEVMHVQVTAHDPRLCPYQGDLFAAPDE